MQRALTHTTQTLKLNGERTTRTYTAEIGTVLIQNKTKSHNTTGIEFDLTYHGMDAEGLLRYRIEVKKRFLLNTKLDKIKNPTKAQQIALKVAAINDLIEIKVNKNFKLIRVVNIQEIRSRWQAIKEDLLDEFPGLEEMADHFDWQLRQENIQKLFLVDNFYSFFFSDLFYHEFRGKQPITTEKMIRNAVDTITIPILEKKKISKKNISFTDVTITSVAEIDTKHPEFSLDKLNAFLGRLSVATGSGHELHFDYKGVYKTQPDRGLIPQGELKYTFEVKSLYKKETTITFNLEEEDE